MPKKKPTTRPRIGGTATVRGAIAQVSVCPHGKLEGFTVAGTFVKLPPHHDHERALAKLAVGNRVEVRGEVIATKPNPVLHHVSVIRGGSVVFDHDAIEHRDKPAERRHTAKNLTGTVVAVGTRKHGEIDRLLLSGNVSVHLGKHAELELDVSLGDVLRVKGVGTKFRRAVFVRATAVTAAPPERSVRAHAR